MAWRSRRSLSHGPLSWPLLPGSELVALCAALCAGPHEYRSDGRTYRSDLRGKGFSTSRAHCLDSGSGLNPLRHACDRRARCAPSERSRYVMVNPCKELIFGKSSPEGKEGPSMSASKERECATESEWALVGAITFLDLRHD